MKCQGVGEKGRERRGKDKVLAPPHPLLGEEVGGVPVPPVWELKWRKEFVRGVVGPRAGQQGNGMRRLSSGRASVCGNGEKDPSRVGGGETEPQPRAPCPGHPSLTPGSTEPHWGMVCASAVTSAWAQEPRATV